MTETRSDVPRRVVLVDDNPIAAAAAQALLQAMLPGADVQVFGDGLRALGEIERQGPDLLVCDVNLPGLDGLSLLSRLRDRGVVRPLRAVLVTAYLPGQLPRVFGVIPDGVPVLHKPLVEATLRAAIANARSFPSRPAEPGPGGDRV